MEREKNIKNHENRKETAGAHPLNRSFRVDFRQNAANLHVGLFGEFNSMCAWELIKLIRRQSVGLGRIFVNTNGLDKVSHSGVDLFKSHMARRSIPKDWLYFKGETGFKIAPDCCRVLIRRKTVTQRRTPLRLLSSRVR